MPRNSYLNLFLISLLIPALPAYATEETTDPYQENLLGNMHGLRPWLTDKGIDISAEYKADFWNVPAGGTKNGSNYVDNLDVKMEMDGEKLFGIQGNKALIYFINNNGGKPNAHRVGSIQGIDNIETPVNTFKLYEAWIEQSFFGDTFSILAGLHDLNSEFSETDMTANFLKPTLQIGQSLAQSGRNGPSIFPTTSLAARVQVKPVDNTYISVAAFDGVPGDPNHPHGTHILLRHSDGLLLIGEAGYTPPMPEGSEGVFNKFAIGAWSYTKRMDDLVDVDTAGDPIKRRMQGVYLSSSYQFYHEAGKTLGAFLKLGMADGDSARVNWDYETGFVANGWIASRPKGEIGVALSQAHNGDHYMQSVSGAADRSEYSWELYYRDQIIPGFNIQPDVQYVMNPGTDRAIDNALVLGLRLDFNF